jgi:hypothetical protein
MEIDNLECQLAQAQMSRYLAGDTLPEDTVQQLELHISSCATCSAAAAEQKISLEEMLAASKTTPVVAPELEVVAPNIREGQSPAIDQDAINAAMQELEEAPAPEPAMIAEEAEPEAPAKKKFALPAFNLAIIREAAAKNFKPLLIGFALGAVLIGMGAFAKKPTAILGKKVSEVHEETGDEKHADSSEKHSDKDDTGHDDKSNGKDPDADHGDKKPVDEAEATDTHAETTDSKKEHGDEHDVKKEDEHKADPVDSHASSEEKKPVKTEKPKAEHAAPTTGVQQYEVAASDGHVVSKKYDGQKKVEAKPVSKPVKKPTYTPSGQATKRVTSSKRRTYRPRVKRSTKASTTKSPKNLKSGQGYIKVYED